MGQELKGVRGDWSQLCAVRLKWFVAPVIPTRATLNSNRVVLPIL
jgi:hypothetical protein